MANGRRLRAGLAIVALGLVLPAPTAAVQGEAVSDHFAYRDVGLSGPGIDFLDELGRGVASLGDVDEDGTTDVALGVPKHGNGLVFLVARHFRVSRS